MSLEITEHHKDIFVIDFISKIENNPKLKYADTDSCIGKTNINIDDEELTIEKFYNDSIGVVNKIGNDNFIKTLTKNYLTPSVSKNIKLQNKKVNYIMKHKVKKRFFNVKIGNKEVRITEDHSLIVLRDKELISIKPKDVKNGDKLFKIYKNT